MALLGNATMVAMYDLDDGWAARHDDWHSHEHMLERVSIPGFMRGRRYVADAEGARCFVLYEATSLDVLTSEAYLERLNDPTPWSARTMPHFRNMTRTLCRVAASAGLGVGARMAVIALSPGARGEALREHIVARLGALVREPGVLSAHLLEGDTEASALETREKELRGGADAVAEWLLMVEGYEPPSPLLGRAALTPDALLAQGAESANAAIGYSLAALLSAGEG